MMTAKLVETPGKPVALSSTPVGRNPDRETPAKAGAPVEGSMAIRSSIRASCTPAIGVGFCRTGGSRWNDVTVGEDERALKYPTDLQGERRIVLATS